jgi:hypothetical protein
MILRLIAAAGQSPSPSPSPTVTAGLSSAPSPSPSPSSSVTAVPALTGHTGDLVLWLVVVGIIAAGVVIFLGRSLLKQDKDGQGSSFIRSWIAISLVIGLLIFCGASLLGTDTSLQSTLFGGLVASTGAAIAFYFSAQAGAAALSAVAGQNAVAPDSFSAVEPPNGTAQASYPGYVFKANGLPAPSYQVASGSLPPGLTLDANGSLHGTPSTAATYTFNLGAFNASGLLISPEMTIAIAPAS